MALATDAGNEDDMEVSWQEFRFRGTWFDNLEIYWKALKIPGPFCQEPAGVRPGLDVVPRGLSVLAFQIDRGHGFIFVEESETEESGWFVD